MKPAWDEGVRWHLEEVEAPEDLPIELAFVRDQHLKVVNGSAEDDYIQHLIRVATKQAERFTQRAMVEQTLSMVLSRFPRCEIEVARPPLISVESIAYIDTDGALQTLDESRYEVSAPHGPTCRRGRIKPVKWGSWPETDPEAMDAVTVTFRAGYVDGSSPSQPDVPEDIKHGMLLLISELYKSRSISIIGFGISVNPALVSARSLWWPYRVF